MISLKKVAVISLMALAFGAPSAFADTGSSGDTAAATETTAAGTTDGSASAAGTVTDSTYGQIDQLYHQLLSLRDQEQGLIANIKSQQEANEKARQAWKDAIQKSRDTDLIHSIEAKNEELRTSVKSSLEQIPALRDQLKQDVANKDKGSAMEVKAQLGSLLQQTKVVREQIKTNDTQLKDARKNVGDLLKQFQAIEAQIKTGRQSIISEESTIHGLRDQKTAQWQAFNHAVQAKDVNAALQALQQIVSLKGQIITILQQVYTEQQAIGTLLQLQPAPAVQAAPTTSATSAGSAGA